MNEYEIRISYRGQSWLDFPWRAEVFRDGREVDRNLCCFHGSAVRWAKRAIRRDLRNIEKKRREPEVIKVQIR